MSAADGAATPSGSPKSRLKFLCSHGGKILPRPFDGQLKYAGGETRVISVSGDIPFHELMKKVTNMSDGQMTLKYQVESEDLDALVSVKSDEDLRHMLTEIERREISGAPRLRAFLFPTGNTTPTDNSSSDPRFLEQSYIDAINGITRPTPHPGTRLRPTIINTNHHGSRVSSACTSPRSPDSCTTEAMNTADQNSYYNSSSIGRNKMHRVRSSPSICSLNGLSQQSHVHKDGFPNKYNSRISSHHVHYPGFQSPRPPMKSLVPKTFTPVTSEGSRYQMDPQPPMYYTPGATRGNGSIHYDDCGHFSNRRVMEMNGGLAMSPISSSPFGHKG